MVVAERNRAQYKVMLGALRVVPMLLAFCALLNMLFDFFGIDSGLISMLGGISLYPLVFLYLSSYVFRFCAYHRMFLHYVVVNNILTYVDYYIGIPVADMTLFMTHIFVAGIFLFLILYFHQKERCCVQSGRSF